MEVPGGMDNKLSVFIYEIIGTIILVYAVLISTGAWIGVVFTLLIAIVLTGDITGAHFNPAVTTAVYFWKCKFGGNFKMFLIYLLAEVIGALIGVGIYYLVLMPSYVQGYDDFPQDWIPLLCPVGISQGGTVYTCDITMSRGRTAFLS